MTLNNLREEIDQVDLQLRVLFEARMALAEKVAKVKLESGDRIFKPEREAEIVKSLTADVKEELTVAYTLFIKKIMELSRAIQYKQLIENGVELHLESLAKFPKISEVCYQGLEGSYSERTAKSAFPKANLCNADSFEAVFSKVSRDEAEMGIVPLENTTAGNINEVYDLLVKYDLYINFIQIEEIHHCLLGSMGASLETIRTVCSHPQALSQCAEFIKEKQFLKEEAINTAVAAKRVSESGRVDLAAIGSKEAAELYGLKILQSEINHKKENATKFIGISKKLIVEPCFNKISVVFSCPHKSGSLAAVLGIFSDYGVNLTELHSRPDGKNPWKYLFYADFPGNLKEASIKALLFQLHEELPFIKILGNYEG